MLENEINSTTCRNELEKALNRFQPLDEKIALLGKLKDCLDALYLEVSCREGVNGEGVAPKFFIEIDEKSKRKRINRVPIISIEEAYELCKGYTILLCEDEYRFDINDVYKQAYQRIESAPIEDSNVMNFWTYYYTVHSEEVLRVFDSLEDSISKATYAHLILVRMAFVKQDPKFFCPNSYFAIPAFAEPDQEEVFVDCGAFVGDTIEGYMLPKIGCFKKIYAFEPMREQFQALSARVERIKREWAIPEGRIMLVNAGIGDESYQVGPNSIALQLEKDTEKKKTLLSEMSLVSGQRTGSDGISVYSIDDYFRNEKVSFIKADIESFEWKLLSGGEKVIKRDKPKLAICIYHTPGDMFRIPLKIKELCPEYKLYVRHHGFRLLETVLYAVVEQKQYILP